MRTHNFPHGWDEEPERKVIARYEEITEDEAAFERNPQTIIEIPNELVPSI